MAKHSINATEPGAIGEEPAPPAEGPEDVPADGPATVDQNPALMPSPLLRYWASSRTPCSAYRVVQFLFEWRFIAATSDRRWSGSWAGVTVMRARAQTVR